MQKKLTNDEAGKVLNDLYGTFLEVKNDVCDKIEEVLDCFDQEKSDDKDEFMDGKTN